MFLLNFFGFYLLRLLLLLKNTPSLFLKVTINLFLITSQFLNKSLNILVLYILKIFGTFVFLRLFQIAYGEGHRLLSLNIKFTLIALHQFFVLSISERNITLKHLSKLWDISEIFRNLEYGFVCDLCSMFDAILNNYGYQIIF